MGISISNKSILPCSSLPIYFVKSNWMSSFFLIVFQPLLMYILSHLQNRQRKLDFFFKVFGAILEFAAICGTSAKYQIHAQISYLSPFLPCKYGSLFVLRYIQRCTPGLSLSLHTPIRYRPPKEESCSFRGALLKNKRHP